MIPETEHDTTIDEIHQTRERLAAKFGGDIRAILDNAPTPSRLGPRHLARPRHQRNAAQKWGVRGDLGIS